VTPAEQVAILIAERFRLDAVKMTRNPAFVAAAMRACAVLAPERIRDEVIEYGDLTGARWPYRVVVARLRWVVEDEGERVRLADEMGEERRWRRLGIAAHRGETLRGLVENGGLFIDEAVGMVAREFVEDDVRAVAVAAVEGRSS
jgi:hypothetical protein